MNDKTSKRPPSLYTQEEEAMERYAKSQGHDNDDLDMNYDAGIETEKPNGMFRFGKAIANAFKPFAAWPGIWKDKEKEKAVSPEKNVMQERQAKAVEAYAELKKSGFKGTQTHFTRQHLDIPQIKEEEEEILKAPPFRDSGIDMDDHRPSYEPNPNDQLISFTEALLAPPPLPKQRSTSPISHVGSTRKSSLGIRKPSLQGLKKVASQIHLSPLKQQSEVLAVPATEVKPKAESLSMGDSTLQRQPSRKDLVKQSRLSKKVSDLENKLETARRELNISISTAPPVPDFPTHIGRRTFKPGTLPSLPSERNMSPQKDELTRSTSNEENIPPLDDRSTGEIAHKAEIFKPGTDIKHVLDLEAAKSKSKTKKASKSHETKNQTPTGVHKRLPRLPSKTPRNSPRRSNEVTPPMPTAPKIIEPVKDVPLASLSKVTDHTSVSHLARAPSPFLGPPASASSPRRTRSTSRRGVSPPPPSLSSATKPKAAPNVIPASPPEKDESIISTSVDVDPIKPEVPQQISSGRLLTAAPGGSGNLAEPIREEFEWDDDVF